MICSEVDLLSYLTDRMGFGCLHESMISSIRENLNNEILPKHLQYFENFLKNSSSGWLAGGNSPSIADFFLIPRLKSLTIPNLYNGISHNILENFPLVRELIDKFYSMPQIAEYYNNHKK
jgi:glutathione S-transferase